VIGRMKRIQKAEAAVGAGDSDERANLLRKMLRAEASHYRGIFEASFGSSCVKRDTCRLWPRRCGHGCGFDCGRLEDFPTGAEVGARITAFLRGEN